MLLNIFITIILVFANAFCVAAEFAIVKVRTSQLKIKAKSGNKLASLSQNIVRQAVPKNISGSTSYLSV